VEGEENRDRLRARRALEIAETGEYDLEGLFLRLGFAIDSVGAKRIVLDTIESCSPGSRTRRCCAPSCGACSAS
jgi:circadian clock protein KaiC